ncbi:MAG: hypothetical protein FJ279_36380 [Planctomycetes bacterium]|nr:hypothetical protein [Planctomycetota bacterium]
MTQAPKEGETLPGRVKRLDEQALAQVFSDNRDRLWRMVNFRLPDALRDRVDPDDVLQDAYLAAVQKLKHYDASAYSTPSPTRTPRAYFTATSSPRTCSWTNTAPSW